MSPVIINYTSNKKILQILKNFILSPKIFIKNGKNIMNSRIFKLIIKNLQEAFSLPKHQCIRDTLSKDTKMDSLPWTPARFEKFKDTISRELRLGNLKFDGTIAEIVDDMDQKYLDLFFGQIWKPTTEIYQYSGWGLVDEINKQDPKAVLDYGCGYNQFKNRIKNLVGIDPYNNCADYMVDALDFKVPPASYDHILVLGSLNFNELSDIELRFEKLVELLMPGGRMYFRANPGNIWPTGPYVDIFDWNFEVAFALSQKYNIELETFKKDSNDRFYFVYHKSQTA